MRDLKEVLVVDRLNDVNGEPGVRRHSLTLELTPGKKLRKYAGIPNNNGSIRIAALKWRRLWQALPDRHRLPCARTTLPEVCVGPVVPGAKSHQFRHKHPKMYYFLNVWHLRNQIYKNVLLSECPALEKPNIHKCMYSLWVSGTWEMNYLRMFFSSPDVDLSLPLGYTPVGGEQVCGNSPWWGSIKMEVWIVMKMSE